MSTHGVKKNLRGATTYGPPSSDAYRDNYDRIFRKEPPAPREYKCNACNDTGVIKLEERSPDYPDGYARRPCACKVTSVTIPAGAIDPAAVSGKPVFLDPPPLVTAPVWRGIELKTLNHLLRALDDLTCYEEAIALMGILRLYTPHADSNVGYVAGCFLPGKAQRILSWCGVTLPVNSDEDVDGESRLGEPLTVRAGASSRP